jgi:hypothetical protein
VYNFLSVCDQCGVCRPLYGFQNNGTIGVNGYMYSQMVLMSMIIQSKFRPVSYAVLHMCRIH